MIQDEEQNCPGEKLVLAGYSQGALVIRIALLQLAADDPSAFGFHIAAVLMLADPAKVSNGAEDTWEADLQQAGSAVENADGIWTEITGLPDSDKGPIPDSVVGQTLCALPYPRSGLRTRHQLGVGLHGYNASGQVRDYVRSRGNQVAMSCIPR